MQKLQQIIQKTQLRSLRKAARLDNRIFNVDENSLKKEGRGVPGWHSS